ncbi:MAG TPA: DUF1236 domain-containing protein [Burkholderiales bacterium]|nr:DUF1236 domain-containing protein [Burkholderiales bacterium]
MKKRMLTGVLVGALMLPVAAYTQVISGTIAGGVIGGPVGAVVGATIGAVNVALLSDYAASQTWPAYVVPGDVVVGTELPSGVVYYRVPPEYVGPQYYTVVNGHTVLIDPSTRRVIAVVK